MKNNSVKIILAKMATHAYLRECRYPVYNEASLFSWRNPNISFAFVANRIKSLPETAEIILLGDDSDVIHAFVKDDNVIHDIYENSVVASSSEREYEVASQDFGKEVFRLSVGEFAAVFNKRSHEVAFSENNKEQEALDFLYSCFVIFRYVLDTSPNNITKSAVLGLQQRQEGIQRFLTKYKVGYRHYNNIIRSLSNNRKYDFQMENSVSQYGKDLKNAVPAWQRNTHISAHALKAMKAFGTYLRKRDSESAKKYLLSQVHKMESRTLVSLFSDAKTLTDSKSVVDLKASQSKLKEQIKKITEKMVGSPVLGLSSEQSKKAMESHPEDFVNYKALRKALLKNSNDFLTLKVRQSGDKLIDYEKAIEDMNREGIPHNFPEGFEGYLDEEGNLYTRYKKKIAGKPTAKVTMNPKYNSNDETYVFSTPSPSGNIINFKTESFAKKRLALKSDAVAILGSRMKTIHRKWAGKIGYKKRENVIATILELIYIFAARVGKQGNQTAGEPTYGMSTLQVKHVKKQGNAYVFQYPGKKGTTQSYKLTPKYTHYKKLVEVIDYMQQNKKPNDTLWTFEGNPIPYSAITSFWKKLDSATHLVGVHKIRNAEATKLAKDLMMKNPFSSAEKYSQTQVEQWYKEEMKKVGQMLQHQTGGNVTSATAIKSYIDVSIQKEFFQKLGLRIPSFVPKTR